MMMRAIFAAAFLALAPAAQAATVVYDMQIPCVLCASVGQTPGSFATASLSLDLATFKPGAIITEGAVKDWTFSAGDFSLSKSTAAAWGFSTVWGKNPNDIPLFDLTASDYIAKSVNDPKRNDGVLLTLGHSIQTDVDLDGNPISAPYDLLRAVKATGACLTATCSGTFSGHLTAAWEQRSPVSSVPLPAPVFLLLGGLAILGAVRRFRSP